jgi:hypothetical protein
MRVGKPRQRSGDEEYGRRRLDAAQAFASSASRAIWFASCTTRVRQNESSGANLHSRSTSSFVKVLSGSSFSTSTVSASDKLMFDTTPRRIARPTMVASTVRARA